MTTANEIFWFDNLTLFKPIMETKYSHKCLLNINAKTEKEGREEDKR